MAHSAATGSAKRTVDVIGKRLGIKRFGNQKVNAGEIIAQGKPEEILCNKSVREVYLGEDFNL